MANPSLEQFVHLKQPLPNLSLNKPSASNLNNLSRKHMEPEIYNTSKEAYHLISRSTLLEFKRSPYHYWYKYKNLSYISEGPTPAQILGHALHTAILEPEKFEEQFIILPKVDKRTKTDAEKWEQLQEEMGNRSILTEVQYKELQAMKASCEKNILAVQLIENTQIKKSIYWNDPDMDILCKCSPDILHDGLVVDLKAAQNGNFWSFSKAVHDYGYHIQAAMIRSALQSIKEIDIKYFYSLKNHRYMSNRHKQNQNQKSRPRPQYTSSKAT